MIADPVRLMVSAHELGHAIAWKVGGFEIVSIRVWGEHRVRGFTELDGGENTTAEETRNYLVGVLAGEVAGERWRDEYRLRQASQECEFDRRNYRKQRRDPLARDLSDSGLRQAARHLIGAHWPEIERLAPLLAQRGTLRI